MFIVVKLKKIDHLLEDVKHISTTWEIAKDKSFSSESILERVEKSPSKDIFYSHITMPIGVSYWARAKRHFDVDSADFWSEPMKVTNREEEISRMMLDDESGIERPYVYVDNDELTGNATQIEIRTSSIRYDAGKHAYTHWFIIDGENNVVWKSMYDKVNLLKVTVNAEEAKLKTKSVLKFLVVHGSSDSNESPIGSYIFNRSEDNLEIDTNLYRVPANSSLLIKFRKRNETQPLHISRVNVIDPYRKLILYRSDVTTNSVIIPWNVLKPDLSLELEIFTRTTTEQYTKIVRKLTTEKSSYSYISLPNYKPKHKLKAISNFPNIIPNFTNTEQFSNGKVYIPNATEHNLFDVYENNNDGLHKTGTIINELNYKKDTRHGAFFKQINSTIFLMDTENADGQSTFTVYELNKGTDRFQLVHSLPRADEIGNVGIYSGIVFDTASSIIYNPSSTADLCRYDITTNTLEKLVTINIDGFNGPLTLIKSVDNKIYCMSPYKSRIVEYSIETNSYKESITVPMQGYKLNNAKSLILPNGSTLLHPMNDINSDGSFRPVNITNEHTEVFTLFDYHKKSFHTLDFLFRRYYPTSSIVMNDGKVYLSVTPRLGDQVTDMSTRMWVYE